MSLAKPERWKLPRPVPEILPATAEQAAEYVTWFVNRKAYSKQSDWLHRKTRRHYFYQAKDRETKERLALRHGTILRHLQGWLTLGLYAINPETQKSKWMAIDGDYGDAYSDLRGLRNELRQDGVEALMEMSKRGAHLWILCAEPLPARLCRLYIYNVALRLGVPIKGALKQVEGIEVFPRKDEVGPNKFGLAIRGPLGIHRANLHRYWFEDAPGDLESQFAFLRKVKRLTADQLVSLTDGLSIPESVIPRPAIQRPFREPNKRCFHILDYVEIQREEGGDYRARCPSCAKAGRDRDGDDLAISIANPLMYHCWFGCTREMIRDALGRPIPQRAYR
jgi:hypothetical protein